MTVRRLIAVFGFVVLVGFVAGCGDSRSAPTSPAACCDKPAFVPVHFVVKATSSTVVRVVCESGSIFNVRVEAEGSAEGYTREGETQAQAEARVYPLAKANADLILAAKVKVEVEVVCKNGGTPPIPPPPPPGPTPECSSSISPTYLRFPYNGGTKEIYVDMSRQDCPWTAHSDSWVGIDSGHSGTGDGKVVVTVREHNTASLVRSRNMTVAGKNVVVEQDPAPNTPGPVNCVVGEWKSWSVWIPISTTTERRTRTRDVLVPASNGGTCPYNLVETEERPITQTPCTIWVVPTIRVGAAAGTVAISVMTNRQDCTWNASTPISWGQLTTASGTGNGQAQLHVNQNTAAERSGPVNFTVSGGATAQTVVTQDAAPASTCVVVIVNQITVGSNNGNGGISVTVVGTGCTWTAISNDTSWLTLKTSSTPGPIVPSVTDNKSGTAYFQAGNNTGAQRNGTITVTVTGGTGGGTATVTQTAGG